jgi:ABC-2 type transport system ATP-binding protein
VIEVQNLTKRYGSITAVNNISFKVERGEILGFLGPNGAGKTTTMRVITGYMPPTEGRVIIAGFDALDQPIDAKKRTGYLPETPPLYPDMTVRDYLLFVAAIKNVPRVNRKAKVDQTLERARVTDMADRYCWKLSKGYRQRVGIAQALIHDPDVLILDEPTAGLDPRQIIETRQLIKDLAGDHTIILSTHILPEVSQTCQRVVIINHGQVVAIDTPDNLTAQAGDSEVVYLKIDTLGTNVTPTLTAVPGVTNISTTETNGTIVSLQVETQQGENIRQQLAAAVVNQGAGLLELRPMQMSLEEVFLSLITEEVPEESVSEENHE